MTWEHVHDEDIAPAHTMNVFIGQWPKAGKVLLFEVNRQGLQFDAYATAHDAIEGAHVLASICYGSSVLMEDPDAYMTRCIQNVGKPPIGCEHEGATCEEMFHRAQVELENEDPDACPWCTRPDRKEND